MKPRRVAGRLPLRRVFAAPLLLALLSGVGLISALFGDDFWDLLSWIGLGVPLVVIQWYVMRA